MFTVFDYDYNKEKQDIKLEDRRVNHSLKDESLNDSYKTGKCYIKKKTLTKHMKYSNPNKTNQLRPKLFRHSMDH